MAAGCSMTATIEALREFSMELPWSPPGGWTQTWWSHWAMYLPGVATMLLLKKTLPVALGLSSPRLTAAHQPGVRRTWHRAEVKAEAEAEVEAEGAAQAEAEAHIVAQSWQLPMSHSVPVSDASPGSRRPRITSHHLRW